MVRRDDVIQCLLGQQQFVSLLASEACSLLQAPDHTPLPPASGPACPEVQVWLLPLKVGFVLGTCEVYPHTHASVYACDACINHSGLQDVSAYAKIMSVTLQPEAPILSTK